MENNQEVTAQGGKIGHRSGKSNRDPLRPVNIGSPKIFWNACQGAPSDAFSQGDASYDNHNTGLILTPNSTNQYGEVYWNKGYDITKDIYLKGTFLSGLGTNGNNCGMYFFDVFVYFNELDNSIYVQTQANAFTSDNYFSGDILGDTTWRTFEVIYEYKTSDVRYVTVLMNGKHICRVDVGAAVVPNNPYVAVFATTVTLTNIHYCKSFEVRSAIPWLTINVPKITNKNDKIFILINDTYVDYVADPDGDSSYEANNIMAYLDDNTIAYETFIDISESGWDDIFILGKAGYIVIPEIENSDILPDLTSGAKNKINNFVSNGGKLLMFNPSNGDVVAFLNDIFSFSINDNNPSGPISLTVSGSSLFPSESATIPDLSATSSLDITTLPVSSVTIYEGNGANESVVTMIPYNSGKIYVLGWDWYNASPLGGEDGGWLHLLESILQS